MAKLTITYPSGASQEKDRLVMVNEEVPISLIDDKQICEWGWQQLQRHDKASSAIMERIARENGVRSIRSAMVGDIFTVDDRHYYCDSVGFKAIDKATFDKILKLPAVERTMGLTWIQNYVLD